MMLHTKYQDALCLMVSKQEDIFMFSLYGPIKTCDPQRKGSIWSKGDYLNKLGKGQLDDATYEISRLFALWSMSKRSFHVSYYLSLHKICDPWDEGHFLLGDATYQISRL